MSRAITLLSIGCVAAIGATAYSMLTGGEPDIAVPKARVPAMGTAVDPGSATAPTGATDAGTTPTADGGSNPIPAAADGATQNGNPAGASSSTARSELDATFDTARRSYSATTISALVQQLEARVAATPKDAASWHFLACTLLQRVIERGCRRGMRPGRPVYTDLPEPILADLDRAQEALERAAELGDDSSAHHRVQAELLSQRITGLASALKYNGDILAAIGRAGERDARDPQLHLVLGVRKLMAPRFLGQDIDGALEHFQYVADQRPTDERPAIFAAMANYLAKKRVAAIEWLERAAERNPRNVFAKAVLQRVRRGEDDPFGRDVTTNEAAAVTPK